MAVAHLVRFETSDQEQIETQLRGYRERELDRAPPPGLRAVRLLRGTDERSVAFYTEWDGMEALGEAKESAPWEACMDLCAVFSDTQETATYEIAD